MNLNWTDVARVIGTAAPMLGTLVGGPAGAAIGTMIANVLGTGNTPDAIHAAIVADPAAALKLAQFESDNQVKLQQMMLTHSEAETAAETARIQADVEDRKSAREREESVKDNTPAAMAWLVVGASVATGVAVMTGVISKDPMQAAAMGTVMGYIFGEAKQVLSYYFGSSSGSAEKTRLLANSMPIPGTDGTTK